MPPYIKKILAFIRTTLEAVLIRFNAVLIVYNYQTQKGTFDKIKRLIKGLQAITRPQELYQIYRTVQSTANITGEIAEVGVFEGASAKVICEAKGPKHVFLFDTYEGLPPPTKEDEYFQNGMYACSIEEVKKYLSKYKRIHFVKGLFPKSAKERHKKLKYSFVHLDVDLYKSTYDSLEFFWPRMTKGGIILSHDYVSKGVRHAFNTFFLKRHIPVIEIPGIQCLVVKI